MGHAVWDGKTIQTTMAAMFGLPSVLIRFWRWNVLGELS